MAMALFARKRRQRVGSGGHRNVRRKEPSKWLRPIAIFLICLGVVVYIFVAGDEGMYHIWLADRNVIRLKTEIKQLEKEKERLEAHNTAVTSDDRTIERLARELYGMRRPNETIYRLVGPDTLIGSKTE